ncbi:MAG: hypothetical protein AAGU32_08650 [Bacillota bacterium]
MSNKIKQVVARQILDCKARPMLEVDVYTGGGALGRGSSPTGTSVGMYETYVLRDGDPSDYDGMSVHTAVRYVKEIIGPQLVGMDVMDQEGIDRKMIQLNGTLGGGSILNCYNTGNVTGVYTAGGVVEVATGSPYYGISLIQNCYNTGAVSSGVYAGGVAGISHSGIVDCYSTGQISSTDGGYTTTSYPRAASRRVSRAAISRTAIALRAPRRPASVANPAPARATRWRLILLRMSIRATGSMVTSCMFRKGPDERYSLRYL